MPSINFVSNTIKNHQSIINRRVAANRLAVAISSTPVVKKVFVIKKMEEVAPQVEKLIKLTLTENRIIEYVPVSIPHDDPVVYLTRVR
jgi:hypothetical protein